jgi:hypothetical protein
MRALDKPARSILGPSRAKIAYRHALGSLKRRYPGLVTVCVAALIYEVVWFQLLELVIGSTAVSLAMLLATFMGGMCLGSLVLPRLVSTERHPLRVYALIEFGIGVLGILVLYLAPLAGGVYTA